jgi:hypothetical protein
MRYSKCQFENPEDTLFCGKYRTKLPSSEGSSVSHTRTLYTPVMDSLKGTTFARRYQIVKELGRGGIAVAYKAEDIKLERTAALKFLPKELALHDDGGAHPGLSTGRCEPKR